MHIASTLIALVLAAGAQAMTVEDLMSAIRAGDAAAVTRLLETAPALADARNAEGMTPLSYAAYAGRNELLPLIRQRRAKPDFWEAAILGDVAAVKAAIASGQDLNARAPDGYTALGLAVFFRHPELADVLLAAGADPSAQATNRQRVGPVHAAVARGDVAMLAKLLERGGDPNARQERGVTPMHDAAASGNTASVALLLFYGASPGPATDDGRTPADMASARGHEALAKRIAAYPR